MTATVRIIAMQSARAHVEESVRQRRMWDCKCGGCELVRDIPECLVQIESFIRKSGWEPVIVGTMLLGAKLPRKRPST